VIKALPGEKDLLEVIVTQLESSEGKMLEIPLAKADRFCDVQANNCIWRGYFYYEV
jgi:hypothetical protein